MSEIQLDSMPLPDCPNQFPKSIVLCYIIDCLPGQIMNILLQSGSAVANLAGGCLTSTGRLGGVAYGSFWKTAVLFLKHDYRTPDQNTLVSDSMSELCLAGCRGMPGSLSVLNAFCRRGGDVSVCRMAIHIPKSTFPEGVDPPHEFLRPSCVYGLPGA